LLNGPSCLARTRARSFATLGFSAIIKVFAMLCCLLCQVQYLGEFTEKPLS
jgi:hypothetical protein